MENQVYLTQFIMTKLPISYILPMNTSAIQFIFKYKWYHPQVQVQASKKFAS